MFKSSVSDMFVIFGEAKIEDMNSAAAAQAAAAEQFKATEEAPVTETKTTVEEVDDDDDVDDSGVDAKDIELVMAQSNVSRARAIKALKANDNDIVNAIMELTM